MKHLILAAALALTATVAHAELQPAADVSTCTADISLGDNSQFVFITRELNYAGTAEFTCVTPLQGIQKYPANVAFSGRVFGLVIRDSEKTELIGAKVTLSALNPEDIYQDYPLATGGALNAAFLRWDSSQAAGVSVKNGVTASVQVNLSVQAGLGYTRSIGTLSVSKPQ